MKPRRAEAGDAGAIASIWNHYIRNTTVTFTTDEKSENQVADYIAGRQSDGACVFVLKESGTLTGFSASSPFRSGPGYAHTLETSVMLVTGASGAGRGRALMHAVEAEARAHPIRALVAGISGENDAAIRFHSALGFDKVGRMPGVGRKFDRLLDLVLMQKTL
ncbi:MAG: N-acetyltransferase family protein [Pseudomonadota bacterium]